MKKNFACTACEDDTYYETEGGFIKHFHKAHPDRPEVLFNAIGKTWDPTLTRIMKEWHDARHESGELKGKLKVTLEQYNHLIDKWNAILMIMRSPER